MTYCEYINTITGDQQRLHREYHDNHYGFPLQSDDGLFERLMLEINQAGLNWILILKKQHNFRKAFDNFNIEKVSEYNEDDIRRLMNDAGIIRNRLKINEGCWKLTPYFIIMFFGPSNFDYQILYFPSN